MGGLFHNCLSCLVREDRRKVMIIKVRGWHVQKQKMFSAEEMAEDQLTLLPTGSFINVNGQFTQFSTIFPNDKFIPLQFIGLLDDNKKEIYNGDIVEFDDSEIGGSKVIGEVIFNDDQTLGGLEWGLWTKDGYCRTDFLGKIKILGNIYENPELLKGIDV
jgi:uncharacterized phage protein (TIGR01671 family)